MGLEDWEKFYGLIAKKVEKREELKEEDYIAWDLADFKRLISSGSEV